MGSGGHGSPGWIAAGHRERQGHGRIARALFLLPY
jgi:hypothetical protein